MTKQEIDTWSLFLTRSFPASREAVFNSFTSIEELKQWFGPGTCSVSDGEMDFRVGGKYKLQLETEMGTVWLEGEFKEIVAPEKLTYTWQWSGNDVFNSTESLVSLSFSEEKGRTTLEMNHTGFETEESRDHHHVGWSGSFDKLLMKKSTALTGRIGWNEITTQDPEKTKSFYSSLFGWDTMEMPVGDMTYAMFQHQGKEVAGIVPLPPEAGDAPSRWVSYVSVDDLAKTTKKAQDLGATLTFGPQAVGEMGAFAVLLDPTGAEIALWESKQVC